MSFKPNDLPTCPVAVEQELDVVEKKIPLEYKLWFFAFYLNCFFDLVMSYIEIKYAMGSSCNTEANWFNKTKI